MKRRKVMLKYLTSEMSKVFKIFLIIFKDFPGFGGDMGGLEDDDEDDLPQINDKGHVHGENCNHDNEKVNLDDLEVEDTK